MAMVAGLEYPIVSSVVFHLCMQRDRVKDHSPGWVIPAILHQLYQSSVLPFLFVCLLSLCVCTAVWQSSLSYSCDLFFPSLLPVKLCLWEKRSSSLSMGSLSLEVMCCCGRNDFNTKLCTHGPGRHWVPAQYSLHPSEWSFRFPSCSSNGSADRLYCLWSWPPPFHSTRKKSWLLLWGTAFCSHMQMCL